MRTAGNRRTLTTRLIEISADRATFAASEATVSAVGPCHARNDAAWHGEIGL